MAPSAARPTKSLRCGSRPTRRLAHSAGVPTAVYYPIPLSKQKGYAAYPSAPTPVTERVCETVISLPMHPDLTRADQDSVIAAVLDSVGWW